MVMMYPRSTTNCSVATSAYPSPKSHRLLPVPRKKKRTTSPGHPPILLPLDIPHSSPAANCVVNVSLINTVVSKTAELPHGLIAVRYTIYVPVSEYECDVEDPITVSV